MILLALIFRSLIIACCRRRRRPGLPGRDRADRGANKAFDLKADSSISAILVVVLFGIGTDYILFLLFRYRERLRPGEDSRARDGPAPSTGSARRSPRPAARSSSRSWR